MPFDTDTLENIDERIQEIESRLIPLNELTESLQGQGSVVNHGHRLEVDKSIRVTDLATSTDVDDAKVHSSLYAFKTITGISEDVVSTGIGDTLELASANDLIGIVGIAADRKITFTFSHLGIEDLTDPGGDRIMFWDDSESKLDWLSVGDSIAITTTTIDTIQDIRTTASPTFANLSLGTGELTCGSINRASGNLTLEIGGTPVLTIGSSALTAAQTLQLSTCINAGTDTDKFLVLDASTNIDFRTGAEVLSDIGGSGTTHRHDGETLQHDAVNSDGGAFSFNTTGAITFNQAINAASGSTIGNLTLSNGSIIDSSGAISFGNENLTTTGLVGVGSGAVGTPGLYFAADTDTGLYYSATQINFAVGGSQKCYMDAVGLYADRIGVGIAASSTYGVNCNYSETTSTTSPTVFRANMVWTPAAHNTKKMYAFNGIVDLRGTANVRDLIAFQSFVKIRGSNQTRSHISSRTILNPITGCTRTLSGHVALIESYTTGGAALAVTGNGYQVWLKDYTANYTISSISYGIKQEGSTLINNFDGEIRIDGDSKSLLLGAAQDMGMKYDGAYGYIETNLVSPSDLKIDCGTDKTIELVETVWKDINLGSAKLSKPSFSAPDSDELKDSGGADTGVETYAFAPGEKVSGVFEMQHDYKQGTDFTFHIHYQGIAAPTGTDKVQWQLIYTITRDGQTLQATTTITAEGDFDTQYGVERINFSAITGSTAGHGGGNVQIGDQFCFQLSRINASADEYGGDALLLTAGIHYQIDTIGSRQIWTK